MRRALLAVLVSSVSFGPAAASQSPLPSTYYGWSVGPALQGSSITQSPLGVSGAFLLGRRVADRATLQAEFGGTWFSAGYPTAIANVGCLGGCAPTPPYQNALAISAAVNGVLFDDPRRTTALLVCGGGVSEWVGQTTTPFAQCGFGYRFGGAEFRAFSVEIRGQRFAFSRNTPRWALPILFSWTFP